MVVVYLSIPTSNHNRSLSTLSPRTLYIFRFLHQTTTIYPYTIFIISCISFDSYIKPQLVGRVGIKRFVVYLSIPTSNHNPLFIGFKKQGLYIFRFLHQTTTLQRGPEVTVPLYIFRFLHQTTTRGLLHHPASRCISFDSYIKPQRPGTSKATHRVVYLSIPTSNHNDAPSVAPDFALYIFRFLHQTTTSISSAHTAMCCISFDSYIKPQPAHDRLQLVHVVYLSIPTSNHNFSALLKLSKPLYIFRFLHQTTTNSFILSFISCCISFDSYIKPQRLCF